MFVIKKKRLGQDFLQNKMEFTNAPCSRHPFLMVWQIVYYKLFPRVLDLETWLNKRDNDNVCNLQRWNNGCHKNGALWHPI